MAETVPKRARQANTLCEKKLALDGEMVSIAYNPAHPCLSKSNPAIVAFFFGEAGCKIRHHPTPNQMKGK
jgi:hypothetical protein